MLGQRFDFAMFSALDAVPTRGAIDENGRAVTLQFIANSRSTLGLFGSGFIEIVARQMTADLQTIRNATPAGGSNKLTTKASPSARSPPPQNGAWDTSKVEGLSPLSLTTTGSADPPSLIVRPFHQAGRIASIREFTNNAFNHHHGMQSTERFGSGADPDGDGVANELTRADITATVVFQATLPVPVRVLSTEVEVAKAVTLGEDLFAAIGCANCHIPKLPLDRNGWVLANQIVITLPAI